MTEAEWLACEDPEPMRSVLQDRGGVSRRKLRLLGCACCRLIWHHFTDARTRAAAETAERYADGLASDAEMAGAFEDAEEATHPERTDDLTRGEIAALPVAERFALRSAWCAWALTNLDNVWETVEYLEDVIAHVKEATGDPAFGPGGAAATRAMSALVRDVAGSPFRYASFDARAWTPSASAIAQAAYDERILPSGCLDNERLAVLSDALEEANCTDEAILTHLRSPGPHVRGCWALDLVLGKE
jgi:hypothetical protein